MLNKPRIEHEKINIFKKPKKRGRKLEFQNETILEILRVVGAEWQI